MVKTIDATFDGIVFRPEEPISLEPNTRVRITVETTTPSTEPPASFLDTASSLNLEGPADWSANLHRYLYGEDADRAVA
jgi:predicted DNA-binding antitoxin AbrB/MazE fold protein